MSLKSSVTGKCECKCLVKISFRVKKCRNELGLFNSYKIWDLEQVNLPHEILVPTFITKGGFKSLLGLSI